MEDAITSSLLIKHSVASAFTTREVRRVIFFLVFLSVGSDGIAKGWAAAGLVHDILGLDEIQWQILVLKGSKLKLDDISCFVTEEKSGKPLRFLYSFNMRRDYSGLPILPLEAVLPHDLGPDIL